MAQYIEVIKTAFLLFPLAALAVTLPYMVVEYKKFGAIPALRTAVVYSFIPVSYTHLDVYKRQFLYYIIILTQRKCFLPVF